jgi:hypothetical protein
MPKCDRCYGDAQVSIMSRFNTDTLCTKCEKKERKHPAYKAAADAELRACQAGNYNYPGIGKPGDLT